MTKSQAFKARQVIAESALNGMPKPGKVDKSALPQSYKTQKRAWGSEMERTEKRLKAVRDGRKEP